MSDGEDNQKPKEPPPRKPRIRPVSRITDSKYVKLRQSPVFPEIDRRLRLGWSPLDLAHALHDEFDEFTDTSLKYLRKLITRYKNTIPALEIAKTINPLAAHNALRKVEKGLNELDEIEGLYKRQMARISIDEANEQKIGKLLPDTANEFVVAMKLLKQSSELKMDLGLVKRQVGAVEITGRIAADITENYSNNTIGKIIADPTARKKLLGLADKILAIGAKPDQIDAALAKDANPREVIDVTSKEYQDTDKELSQLPPGEPEK